MSQELVRERALEALVKVTGYPRDAFQPESRLMHVLGLDSLQIMDLRVELEQHFLPVGEAAFRNPRLTFGELVELLQLRDAAAPPAPAPKLNVVPTVPAAPTLSQPRARQCRLEEFEEVREIRTLLTLFEALGIQNPYWSTVNGVARDTLAVDGTSRINFATYNYLGLSGDERVTAAAAEAARAYGTSASASRVASGDRPIHRALERALADVLECDDALAFASGHATNVTAIATLVGPGDLVVHDALAHDSLLAGARLSGARRIAFPHNDLAALDRLLTSQAEAYRRVLIVVEGAYSMDGDLAPLAGLVELKKRHGALLFVDEAHSFGCVGATGRGIGEHAGVDRRDVDAWMGTLSKAMASCGGYIAGSRALIDLLKYRGGGFVYAAALSPANAAAALKALELMQEEPWRVTTLQQRAAHLAAQCRARGIEIGQSADTAIVPVMVGPSVRCLHVADALRREGIHVPPIFYPAVEEGRARLRFFVSAMHTQEQLDHTVEVLAKVLAEHPLLSKVEAPQPRLEADGAPNPLVPGIRRVFVTGASGFIGSRVVRELRGRGLEVRCLLRPTSKTHRLEGLQYETILGDLEDKASLERGVRGCDAVIHLACASSWAELRALGERIDAIAVGGTRSVLEAARAAGVKRFVHVSSAAAVNASDTPALFDERTRYELEARGLAYSFAKKRAEELVLAARTENFDVVIASPAEVYGPEDDRFVTAGNILDILKAPTPVACAGGVSVAHVDDVAAGIVHALRRGRSGERYLLGGENLTVHDLTRLVLRLGGRRDSVVDVPNEALLKLVPLLRERGLEPPMSEDSLDYATLYWFFDSHKAARELGYKPRGAEATLAATVDWLRQAGHYRPHSS